MRVIADLHIHSRYSRACSQDLTPESILLWAEKKGIKVVGTGDFTHPGWLSELKASLVESRPGLYQLRQKSSGGVPEAYFVLSAELSSIYKQEGKVRRVHTLVLAPNFNAVDRIVANLEERGANLKSDGRPITGINCEELAKIIFDADPYCVVIPAHVWTPHFGVFGSLSGFDSIEEAYGGQAKNIFALETGLSSDPKMNWRLSQLDRFALVSNSDAHSLRKIGREANVFEIDEKFFSFPSITESIKDKNPERFLSTLEFFPEEGKYHLDGHADCAFSCLPEMTRKLSGTCPKCGKKLLVGVLNRVAALGERPYGLVPKGAIPFRSVVPLEEVLAETLGVGVASKKVVEMYERMTSLRPEFEILLDASRDEIAGISNSAIAESVIRVREGNLQIEGGYDGVFGKIEIYTDEERDKLLKKAKQESLF